MGMARGVTMAFGLVGAVAVVAVAQGCSSTGAAPGACSLGAACSNTELCMGGIASCTSNCQCLGGKWQAPCPMDLPRTGTACTPEGAYCGYTTSTNACEADNCYCKAGAWNCEPSCAIGPLEDDSGAADAFVAQCTNAAACMVGEVCCVIAPGTTKCEAGPCPSVPANSSWGGGPFQLCATAAECLAAGDTCGYYSVNPGNLPGIFSCNPPDGGTTDAATDTGIPEADACAPSGCTGSCLSGRHNVSTMVDGCLVWECCVPDDAGADASGE